MAPFLCSRKNGSSYWLTEFE